MVYFVRFSVATTCSADLLAGTLSPAGKTAKRQMIGMIEVDCYKALICNSSDSF